MCNLNFTCNMNIMCNMKHLRYENNGLITLIWTYIIETIHDAEEKCYSHSRKVRFCIKIHYLTLPSNLLYAKMQ